ncbi:histidine-type phosphatase [Streptomyces spongiae]|uniref:Multiple inositol polyphosphate phosphatase 1 n=1 Tax=Streptomyces spongiae TaxID=565072 RepID=A0A5N8XEQ9_9ACTN|nr:histidine-type phosphatase [Streptomyces spongiae]MPY58013.1 histidine phosphatase family protein [Streptomyces spongiae]
MRRLALSAVALTALTLPVAAPANAVPVTHGFYATKTPYEPLQDARSYQHPPQGFVPVFTETVSRHGTRASTDSDDGDLILALWDKAAADGELTPLGEHFGLDVRSLEAAMAKIGYGQLTARGKQDMQNMAARLEQRLPELFRRIARNGEKIDVVSSGKDRAVDSGNIFATALGDDDPAVKPLIGAPRTDPDLLYFHKSAGGAAYRDYIASDQRLASTLAEIKDQPATQWAARRVLLRLFTPAFVATLDSADQVDAAEAVYNLYAAAPALSEEGTWHMDRYIAPRDARWFAYLSDAEDFYEKGPGFKDSGITYAMAQVLLDDFFAKLEAARSGTGDLGAELRFTHAEEIIPLAVLLGLPGSTQPVTEARPYTYADNAWRGASVAPMAANIQWDLFRKGDHYLVRMLYNEKETAFRTGCRPVAKGSYFYDVDELERCYGRTGTPTS